MLSDYLEHSYNELYVHLALLIPAIFCGGFSIGDLLVSTNIPIPKCKTNICDSTNYRIITLSSIIGKVLDLHSRNCFFLNCI